MTVINPPGFLQNAGATHTAEQMRNWVGGQLSPARAAGSLVPRGGVNRALGNWLEVTQTGSPSMAVVVRSGLAYIPGTQNARQGVYTCLNDGDVTLSIAAAHATLDRIDIVVFRVQDSAYSGATNTASLEVVTGTPASSPAAPSAPDNSIVLAQVAVAANATSITNANITSVHPFAPLGIISVSGQTERNALVGYDGLVVYRRDSDRLESRNGSGGWSTYAISNDFNRVGVRLQRTSNQSVANATVVPISWNQQDEDTNDLWSSGSTITLSSNGIWVIDARISYSGVVGTGRNFVEFNFGGGHLYRTPFNGDGEQFFNTCQMGFFTGGSQFVVNVFQSSGGALNITHASLNCYRMSA